MSEPDFNDDSEFDDAAEMERRQKRTRFTAIILIIALVLVSGGAVVLYLIFQ